MGRGGGRRRRGGAGGDSARSAAVLPLGARAGREGVEYCGVVCGVSCWCRMCGGRRPVEGRGGRVFPLSTGDVDRLVFAGVIHGRDHHRRGETPPQPERDRRVCWRTTEEASLFGHEHTLGLRRGEHRLHRRRAVVVVCARERGGHRIDIILLIVPDPPPPTPYPPPRTRTPTRARILSFLHSPLCLSPLLGIQV